MEGERDGGFGGRAMRIGMSVCCRACFVLCSPHGFGEWLAAGVECSGVGAW